jgi:hypothetical protein
MKTIFFVLGFALLCTSCIHVDRIGQLNMVSRRNIQQLENYKLLSRYEGSSQKELRQSRARTLEEAIDQAVKKVPGGEFLMNANFYKIKRRRKPKHQYFAATGDVWGIEGEVIIKRFKMGDKVTWTEITGRKTGSIIGFKDDINCIVQTKDGRIAIKKMDQLIKIQE